ncbi:melatonin receptor type 1A-like [Patiria miniata]|uniref:G-protein coupled receptors family 1 profile domain-containing protein n=1 Tax=Patiria miniata TaxID=46514 RepID=A0A913ZU11_PATMI|nr:melatonin receptor type 1A-like [Patiria miniata]
MVFVLHSQKPFCCNKARIVNLNTETFIRTFPLCLLLCSETNNTIAATDIFANYVDMESRAENGTDAVQNSAADGAGLSSSQIIGVIAGLAGILGNGLVCFVMLRYRSAFNSITNKLTFHQSVIDFSLSVVMVATRLYTPWTELYCRFFRGWLYWGFANVSTYSLVLICFDRYVGVCHAAKYRQLFSVKRVKISMFFVWLLPSIFQLNMLLFHVNDGASCVAIWPEGYSNARKGFGIAAFTWEYFIPFLLIVITYSQTILALRKRLRAKAQHVATAPSTSHHNTANTTANKDPLYTAKVKLTVTFLVVAIFFVICWGPTSVTWFLFNFELLPGSYYSTLWHLGLETPLLCLNSCVNPVIYFVMYTHFRQHLIKAVCGRCKSNRVGDGSLENVSKRNPRLLLEASAKTEGRGQTKPIPINV